MSAMNDSLDLVLSAVLPTIILSWPTNSDMGKSSYTNLSLMTNKEQD